jgi:hypothetical protein
VVLNRDCDEDNIESEFDMKILFFDDRAKGHWGVYGIGLPRDIDGTKPNHHVLLMNRKCSCRRWQRKIGFAFAS